MKTFLMGMALLLALAACTDKQAPPEKSAAAAPAAADPAAGKMIAERECKGCHGLDGKGTAPGIPHLASQRERYLLASLEEYKEAKRPHPSRREMAPALSEGDRRNVAAYYAGLPAAKASSGPQAVPSPYDEGRTLASGCSKCHGEDGNSKIPGTPSLAGQQPYYLVTAMHEYQRGERTAHAMKLISKGPDKLQLERLALHFATQTPASRPASQRGNADAGSLASGPCSGCHGADGVSHDASIPNLAGQDAAYLLKTIKAYRTTTGHWGMQRYVVGLSEQDIANLTAFFATQPPQAAVKPPLAAENFVKQCDRCHDVDNAVVTAPKLRGQDKDYLVMALRAYRDGRRVSSTMHNMSSPYSIVLIDTVARWYAGQATN
jgi:cytochrome c553